MPKKQHKRHKDDAVSVLEVLAAKQQEETEDAEDERVDPLFPAMLSGLSPGGGMIWQKFESCWKPAPTSRS